MAQRITVSRHATMGSPNIPVSLSTWRPWTIPLTTGRSRTRARNFRTASHSAQTGRLTRIRPAMMQLDVRIRQKSSLFGKRTWRTRGSSSMIRCAGNFLHRTRSRDQGADSLLNDAGSQDQAAEEKVVKNQNRRDFDCFAANGLGERRHAEASGTIIDSTMTGTGLRATTRCICLPIFRQTRRWC